MQVETKLARIPEKSRAKKDEQCRSADPNVVRQTSHGGNIELTKKEFRNKLDFSSLPLITKPPKRCVSVFL